MDKPKMCASFGRMTTEAAPVPTPTPSTRLDSLDALRGFDMCWILGLSGLMEVLLKKLDVPWKDAVVRQLDHVDWEGFHFYDLIFPLFLFIAGVSLAIALPKRVARVGRSVAARQLVVRALILFVLGVIYSGGLQKGLDQVRWLGVLQRIALGSCFAGLLSLWLQPRGLVMTTIFLLVGYWALLTFVPVPEVGAGNYAEGKNLTNYIDRMWLPGHKYDGDHDPEGILSTLPAIATALLGILAGHGLMMNRSNPAGKTLGLLVAGGFLLLVGWQWNSQFPVIKRIWSSSFVMVAGGWSAILLGVFYGVVDGLGWKRWAAPFIWVGANPIALYLGWGLRFFSTVAQRLVGPTSVDWLTPAVDFALVLLVARFLYKRGIYLRA
jgi:predicted acyltransferase